MALRSDWSAATCPIAHAADVLADPWVLLVLRELFSGRTGFDELRDATGAADSVLSRRLRTMRDADLIVRGTDGYRLTEAGAHTLPILHAYARFSARIQPDGGWGLTITCGVCGTRADDTDRCPGCDTVLDATTAQWSRRSMGGTPFPLATAIATSTDAASTHPPAAEERSA